MRSVNTSTLEALKPGGHGPWRMGDDRLLKACVLGKPLSTEADARELFDRYRVAWDAGVGSPRPFEVVRIGTTYGVVVEYVRGLTMDRHLAFGSYAPEEAGEALGGFLRRLHAHQGSGGHDLNANLRRRIRYLEPLLGPTLERRLASLAELCRGTQAFLHGDLHLGNVVVRRGELVPIDLELSGFGHPLLDLAATRTRLLLNNHVPLEGEPQPGGEPAGHEALKCLWRSLLATYGEGATLGELDELDRQTAALAEIEHCCFKYGIDETCEDELSDRQRRRVALCRRRLATLLPSD